MNDRPVTACHRTSQKDLRNEGWEGETIWEGVVEVFGLKGHAQATRAYAWEARTDSGGRRVVAVLDASPVDSPAAAVRAAIASGRA